MNKARQIRCLIDGLALFACLILACSAEGLADIAMQLFI